MCDKTQNSTQWLSQAFYNVLPVASFFSALELGVLGNVTMSTVIFTEKIIGPLSMVLKKKKKTAS
jgi:hypothetical protein